MPRIAKILLIGPLPPPIGGTTVLYKQLVDDLSERDDIRVWTLNASPPKRTLFISLLWIIYISWRLAWLVPKVDVVSLHASMRAPYTLGPMVWFFCKVFRKKSMFRKFGGIFDQEFEQLLPILKWAVRNTTLDMDLLLFETKHLVEYFRNNASKPVAWFSNSRPLPSDLGSLDSNAPLNKARRFVFVGHVAPRKGVREIIEASSQIEEDIVVDVYGPLLDGLTADEFDGQRTVYRGMLPPDKVIETLKQYDILLLPTYHLGEGYPGVILEGYCAGIPVITTKWNAIPEIVDRTSGILVNPRDVEGLREAMLHLIRSPEEYARLRKGAKKKAQEFSSETWTEKFVELTLGLLKDQDL